MADVGGGRRPPMTDAGSILREEIAHRGPVSFQRFMEVALYHPKCGYYRRGRDPFGRAGDYYTAEQIQPVFGILLSQRIRQLCQGLGPPSGLTLVELGAGRAEMAQAFSGFRYCPVEVSGGEWPGRFTGAVFCNEFFDALPVQVAVRRRKEFRELLVGWREGRFAWIEGPPLRDEPAEYLARYAAHLEEGGWIEVNLAALRWLEEIASRLERGWVVAIDYGYTARELVRFPRGTLMSYRRHAAAEDVLSEPGERDITAHVNFSALQDHAALHGFQTVRLENLSRTLMDAGEPDGFAAALATASPSDELRRRLALKTLLFGMGETFRTLLLRKPQRQ